MYQWLIDLVRRKQLVIHHVSGCKQFHGLIVIHEPWLRSVGRLLEYKYRISHELSFHINKLCWATHETGMTYLSFLHNWVTTATYSHFLIAICFNILIYVMEKTWAYKCFTCYKLILYNYAIIKSIVTLFLA